MITQGTPDLLRPAPSPRAKGDERGRDGDAPATAPEAGPLSAETAPASPRREGRETSAPATKRAFERVMQTQAMETPAMINFMGSTEMSPPARAPEAAAHADADFRMIATPGVPHRVFSDGAPPAAAQPKPAPDGQPPSRTFGWERAASAPQSGRPETVEVDIQTSGNRAIETPTQGEISRNAKTPPSPDAILASARNATLGAASSGSPAAGEKAGSFTPSADSADLPKSDRPVSPDARAVKTAAHPAEPMVRPNAERTPREISAAAGPFRPSDADGERARPDRARGAEAVAAPPAADPSKSARKTPAPTAAAVGASDDRAAEIFAAGRAAEEIAATEQTRASPGHAAASRPIAMATGISTQIAAAVVPGKDGTVEIRLDPPELGRVKVTLTSTEAGVAATIVADRPEIADLLRRHADILQRELRGAGHEEVTLSFGSTGSEPRRGDGYDRAPDAAAAPAGNHSAAGAPAIQSATWRDGAGLDIRL